MAESVKVIVRCRPMNERERNLNCKACITCDEKINRVSIFKSEEKSSTHPPKNFTFDGAYFTNSTTKQIYEDVAFALVDGVLEGYNGTVFAYGQTGCGKSFSMQGITDPPEQRGIIPRAFEHIFEAIDVEEESTKFLVQASYLEIYNEEIRDLLGKDTKARLELRESPDRGVYTQGLSHHIVKSISECIKLMDKGWMSRSTGATLMNAESSRSHSIFAIRIEMSNTDENTEDEKIKVGKLNLVDLAGSERQGKTGATGDRLREATKINLSLSALGNVISALVDGKSKHIPYRDSKLTRLLQDSLGGNTKTMMVACISPADNNYDETLSTLRYANRAKNIKNKPKINEDPKDALLREYQAEIEKLKAMLEGRLPLTVAEQAAEQAVAIERTGSNESDEAMKKEYEEQIALLNQKYEDEKMSKLKLNEELEKLKEDYEGRKSIAGTGDTPKQTSDMALSPIGTVTQDTAIATSPLAATEPESVEDIVSHMMSTVETPDSHVTDRMDVQSVTSSIVNTPLPDNTEMTVQLTIQQAESLSPKQLSSLVLSPAQVRMLGYDGPVTPAHIACLALAPSQIAALDLSPEQRASLSTTQATVLSTVDEQCERLAYNQLVSFVDLLKNTPPLQLYFDQAQTLSADQLAALVLSKEQSKELGGATSAQDLTLEQISQLRLTPAQIAQLRLSDEQIADLGEAQYETVLKVRKLLERQELMNVLSDPHIQNLPTVTLTSSQVTQLDPSLVDSLPLTEGQEKIMKEFKDSFTHIEVSDLDVLPLLPHQVKHLKVDESCSLDADQTAKVGQAMETQKYLESAAIATMCDLEEGLTKTVTLTPAEVAVLSREQFTKIQVAVSEPVVYRQDEAVTLTPIEIHQMALTEEQKEQIKAKKIKRIEKHGKVVKKLKKQSATLLEMSVERSTSPPVLTLSEEQACQVQGMVAPTRDQQTQLSIEPGRQLDSEELGGVVLTEAQISQLEMANGAELAQVLDPEQRESWEEAKQRTVRQDALRRLNEIQPLSEVEMTLTEPQIRKLTSRQLENLRLTPEQCDILGLVPGQSLTVDEISLISLNGEQIIQLRLTEEQLGGLSGEQKSTLSALTNRAVQELAYLKMREEDGVLRLTGDQVGMLTEEQLARLSLNPEQTALIGMEGRSRIREVLSQVTLTATQLTELSLTSQQQCFLTQEQKKLLTGASEQLQKEANLQEVLRLTAGVAAAVTSSAVAAQKKGREGEEKKKVKLVRLTAEQASLLTKSQLASLQLTPEQLASLGPGVDEVTDLTPSQLSTIAFTPEQISALKISQNQLKGMQGSKKANMNGNRKSAMPRVQEMPLSEEAGQIGEALDQEEAIRLHQAALSKLQQLQQNMVTGGGGGGVEETQKADQTGVPPKRSKQEIKEKLRRRREAAEAKRRKLRKAMAEGDEEGVIEELFSLQVEEVEERNRKLGKIKDKYQEKVQEIEDLHSEFQVQREDYLESIREQSQETKLLQQILEQIQPLLRRDSNYYNLDAIKRDCKWNPETGSWFIPPVMITKTKLPAPDMPSTKGSLIQPAHMDYPDDTKIRNKLINSVDKSDYFRSKRAQKILEENKLLSQYGRGGGGGHYLDDSSSDLQLSRRNVLDPIEKKKKRRSKHYLQ